MSDYPRWDEPEQAGPWTPSDGAPAKLTHYGYRDAAALWVLVNGHWLWMNVYTRYDWSDGRVSYRGDIHLPDPANPSHRTRYERAYWWPQPGKLRVAQLPA